MNTTEEDPCHPHLNASSIDEKLYMFHTFQCCLQSISIPTLFELTYTRKDLLGNPRTVLKFVPPTLETFVTNGVVVGTGRIPLCCQVAQLADYRTYAPSCSTTGTHKIQDMYMLCISFIHAAIDAPNRGM